MEENHFGTDGALTVSTETIIARIRAIRDRGIQQLLEHDDVLMDTLEDLYDTVAINPVKREFIKRDLADLKSTTLDLVHYSSLITAVRKNPVSVNPEVSPLYTEELRKIFSKYGL